MSCQIDINFDFRSDSPLNKDPDAYSPTLRNYHKLLWSKPLPNGHFFELVDTTPNVYLHNNSELGEFFLSSDAITHSYSKLRDISHIIRQVPNEEIDGFFAIGCTMGGYLIFPANKINNKMTINGSRGLNRKIKDRFDLTLECIRRYYTNESSPLSDTLQRYKKFFALFHDFKGYVEFFLLQDLVKKDFSSVKFHVPFNSFDDSPLPGSLDEYLMYKKNTIEFIKARGQRMFESIGQRL